MTVSSAFKFLKPTTLIVGLAFFSSIVQAKEACKSIAEIACSNQDFSTLCTAITAAGLGTVLSGGSWTVFAPTNAAFQNLGADLLNAALDDKELLTTILLNHAVDEKLLAKDLVCSSLVEMAGGEDTRTVCMRNGTVIYQKGGSNSRDKMPRVVTTNMAACNGLIHVVDQVILPSRLPTPPAPPKQCKTIAEIACADQNLTTLCAAVKQAGLATAFSTGTYTVFAPTDIAFKALPKATLDMYLANKQKLANLLLYHVVADQEIYEADLRCQRLLTMANGKDSRTFCSAVGPGVADNVYQKGRGNPQVPTKLPKIVMTDIAACNGLIHIVDNVMLP